MFAQEVFLCATVSFALLNGNTHGQSSCNHDSDCSGSKVCCPEGWHHKECAYSCLYRLCSQDTDCRGLHCCNNLCRASCEGRSCYHQSDCGGNTHCCNDGICDENCLGKSCFGHSDCYGHNEICCNYVCQIGTCQARGLVGWTATAIVLSVFGFVGILIGIVLYAKHRRFRRSPSFVVAPLPLSTVPGSQSFTTATAFVDSDDVNCPNEPPPAYQPPQQQVLQPPQGLQSVSQPSEAGTNKSTATDHGTVTVIA